MILKPTEITPNATTFPADEDIEISWKNNGDMMVAFKVTIEDNDSASIIYTSGKVTSSIPNHIVPAGSLVNEKTYRYRITVYNSINRSVISDYMILKTSARPNVIIPNDGYIRNQLLSVEATYSQSAGVNLKSYQFFLYDAYGNLLEKSDELLDRLLRYSFKYQLVDGHTYKVECVCVSQNNVSNTSGKIALVADYNSLESYSNLSAQTYIDKPYVELQWSLVRNIGKPFGTINYIDNKKVDLTNGLVTFNDNFSVDNDFTLKLWLEGLSDNDDIDIGRIAGANGELIINFSNKRFHIFKNFGNLTNHIASNKINESINGKQLFLSIIQINNRINMYCEVN